MEMTRGRRNCIATRRYLDFFVFRFPTCAKSCGRICPLLESLSPKPHLCFRETMQCSKEDLVPYTIIILHMEDLRQPDLPGRIALQFNVWSEEHKEIRFTLYTFHNLGIHKIQ